MRNVPPGIHAMPGCGAVRPPRCSVEGDSVFRCAPVQSPASLHVTRSTRRHPAMRPAVRDSRKARLPRHGRVRTVGFRASFPVVVRRSDARPWLHPEVRAKPQRCVQYIGDRGRLEHQAAHPQRSQLHRRRVAIARYVAALQRIAGCPRSMFRGTCAWPSFTEARGAMAMADRMFQRFGDRITTQACQADRAS